MKTEFVHYVLGNHAEGHGMDRPAIVVNSSKVDLPEKLLNLQVFTDGRNDNYQYPAPVLYVENVKYSADLEPGTWHYPGEEPSTTEEVIQQDTSVVPEAAAEQKSGTEPALAPPATAAEPS